MVRSGNFSYDEEIFGAVDEDVRQLLQSLNIPELGVSLQKNSQEKKHQLRWQYIFYGSLIASLIWGTVFWKVSPVLPENVSVCRTLFDIENPLKGIKKNICKEFSLQYDLSGIVESRKASLQAISKEMQRLMKMAIAYPDPAHQEALRRTLLRFEEVDYYQMSLMAPLLQRKKIKLKEKDRNAFDSAIAVLGINHLDAYQRRIDDISVSSCLIRNGIEKIHSSLDIVEVARVTKALFRLFAQMKKDPLVCVVTGLSSLEEKAEQEVSSVVKKILENKTVDQFSQEEKESLFYIRGTILGN